MAPIITKSSKQPVRVENRKANDFVFKSCLVGPIGDLSVLRRSLLFAEIAMAAYLPADQCNLAAGKLGFTDGKSFCANGVQACWFQNQFDSVIVFRGAEINHWSEFETDSIALPVLSETVGKIHRNFKNVADEIWPQIENDLVKNENSLWFCGHSVGGAIATICAARCMLSYIKSEPRELFTFGSPRVGCKRYTNHVKLDHYRWVNKNDVVTRFPPSRLGYRHAGIEMGVDSLGRLKCLRGLKRISDSIHAVLSELRRSQTAELAQHLSPAYVDAVFKIVRTRESNPGIWVEPNS